MSLPGKGSQLKKLTLPLIEEIKAMRLKNPMMSWGDAREHLVGKGVDIAAVNIMMTCRNHARVMWGRNGWVYEPWCAPEVGRGRPRKRLKKTVLPMVDKLGETSPKLPVFSTAPSVDSGVEETAVIRAERLSSSGLEKGGIGELSQASMVVTDQAEIKPTILVENTSKPETQPTPTVTPKVDVSPTPRYQNPAGVTVLPVPTRPAVSSEEMEGLMAAQKLRSEESRRKKREAQEARALIEKRRLEDEARTEAAGRAMLQEELHRNDPFKDRKMVDQSSKCR